MTVRSDIVLALAGCGVYGGGGGLVHVQALESLKTGSDPAPERTTCAVTLVVAGVACAAMTAVVGSARHGRLLSSLNHVEIVLTDRLERLTFGEMLVLGSGLAVIAVLGFAAAVATWACPSAEDRRPAFPRLLMRDSRVPRRAVRRSHRPGGGRLQNLTRPPTLRATRPASRPVGRKPSLGAPSDDTDYGGRVSP